MLRKIFNFKEYNLKHYNIRAMLAAFLLSFIGLTIIKEVQKAEDMLYERQIFGIVLGIVVALIISVIDYHFVCKFYILFYLVNLTLLVLTRTSLGHSYHDARRWLIIPKIGQVQPSEFSKLLLILFFARLFDRFRKKIDKIYFLLLACILMGVPLLLILKQPDLSTALALLAMFAGIVFLSGLSYKLIFPALAVAIPACIGLWWYIQQDFQFLLEPYQQRRILALKHPELYPDLMWQQNNAAIAIRAGGLAGKFTGGSTQPLSCKILPAIESDFIYTAVAEAYGFIGSCIVISLMAFLVYRAFYVAFRAKDYLGMLVAGGIGCMLAFQTIINICVNTSIFPNTGIPFPFLSSGLSSLLGSYMMIGVLMNVSLQIREKEKEDSLDLGSDRTDTIG
ncbi:MAG: FtsW/RodA/SpoVE family cell cycle protein [Lachnospiraceae bacterium]|nr:FtsW/RodA/SpoVE family cell cycle protein [Lachnospiraceae bacterium]